ncbi:hypothetical protein GWI33_020201 [Rhynchophorus ferrugineus]|uniref:Tudor domain-containing protein n=1 Tax=Rhynchophorus ferrugineus TaxID=354439 RepID=A0A834HPX4_RHYFE|nr:hypothetical protein GWI33_020201 [Rhynchophorus ferrugineus]
MEPLYVCVEEENKIIPSTFSMTDWKIGDVYRMRVVHVNSPTDFWIVKSPELFEKFHNNLYDFYTKYGRTHRLIALSTLNRYWIVYVDGWYCRAILTTNPSLVDYLKWQQVFLVDFGRYTYVRTTDFFWFTDELHNVPQFSIRATLTEPSRYQSPVPPAITANFKDMFKKKILLVKLTGVDNCRGIIHLDLFKSRIEKIALE